MTKIRCPKCKKYTDTVNEEQMLTEGKNRPVLSGECAKCNTSKLVFTNKDFAFKQKNPQELKKARENAKIARVKATICRKTERLGDPELLECVKKCLRKHIEF